MAEKESQKPEEIIIQGVPASPGMAMGAAFVYRRKPPEIEAGRITGEEVNAHLSSFSTAKERLETQWQKLRQQENDPQSKSILAAQVAIINDPDLSKRIKQLIAEEQYSAQRAIGEAFRQYMQKISETDNAMMADRLIDLSDIRDRLLEVTGTKEISPFSKNGDILVTEEISPREVIQLSHQDIKGFVMERGGNTSHAAIIARSLGIPAVVGAKGVIEQLQKETVVCLDGERGLVSINPSEHTRKRVQDLKGTHLRTLEERLKICSQPSRTKDGKPFIIRANVEFAEELTNVRKFKAEGIGLLRTESIYLNQEQFGSARKQTAFYENLLTETAEDPVVIRLFDVGGDKFQGTKITESNPFLGWRGVRMLLDERSILRDQLKAVLITAGRHPGRVRLLVPMVSTINEMREVKDEIHRCEQELADEGHPLDAHIQIGMMVEIPSTAIQAEHYAPEVDFFSIGTNDLTQYLLAVDRGNALISKLYDQAHPAMWQLIADICDAAHEHGIGVDVCGELAAKPAAAACLLGLGITSLSMSPVRIADVKQLLMNRSLADMQELAAQVQRCTSTSEVEKLFENWKEIKRND